jgi:hypothetical protein
MPMSAKALISSALPKASRKNMVACSPGSPLKPVRRKSAGSFVRMQGGHRWPFHTWPCSLQCTWFELPAIPPVNVNTNLNQDHAGEPASGPAARRSTRRGTPAHPDLRRPPASAEPAESSGARTRVRVGVPTAADVRRSASAGQAHEAIERLPAGLRALPEDIEILFKLANNAFPLFALPAPLADLTRVQGIDVLSFPCQVGAGIMTRMVTRDELSARLRAINNLPATFEGSSSDHLMTAFRYVMVGCLARNVVSAAAHLSLRYEDPQATSVIRIAGSVAPAVIHALLYKRVSEVQEVIRGLGRTDLSDLEAATPGTRNLAEVVRERIRQINAESSADMRKVLLSFVAYLIAYVVVNKF